ncbi:MAG: hypothetical protein H0W70_01250 [Actinobacteria bacterium]|nr:hypothetical protein [Actinomycetota bacterium]
MTRKTDIVVTTIFEPAWLDGYLTNLATYGRSDDVTIRIVCDRKTPDSVYSAAAAAQGRGFAVDCPTLDEQTAYLAKLGLEDFVPWDTDNRRNIGFLKAWESGAEVLISIDDDNYCRDGSDYVAEHHVVGTSVKDLSGHRVAGGAPWFNICSLLDIEPVAPVYPRGYPYAAKRPEAQAALGDLFAGDSSSVVAINAGLWLDDPDADAITRLALSPHVRSASTTPVLFERGTWSPINTQNTALIRDAISAYYYVRMGFELHGLKIDRFGDILSGYFVQACAKHLGHTVRVGSPVVDHRRTPHNLFKDLHEELAGVILLEDLVPWLQDVELAGDTYADTYADLAERLLESAASFSGMVWDQGGREFLSETALCMQTWLGALRQLAP